jgi:hypothetical protein
MLDMVVMKEGLGRTSSSSWSTIANVGSSKIICWRRRRQFLNLSFQASVDDTRIVVGSRQISEDLGKVLVDILER